MKVQNNGARKVAAPKTVPDSPPLPNTSGPIDIALNAELASAPHSDVARDLQQQSHLVQQQISLARNERFRNRIKAVRDLSLSTLVIAALLVVITSLWQARQASGLVVEPFTVSAELSEQGGGQWHRTGRSPAGSVADNATGHGLLSRLVVLQPQLVQWPDHRGPANRPVD